MPDMASYGLQHVDKHLYPVFDLAVKCIRPLIVQRREKLAQKIAVGGMAMPSTAEGATGIWPVSFPAA